MAFAPFELHKTNHFKDAVLISAETRKMELIAAAQKDAAKEIEKARLQLQMHGNALASSHFSTEIERKHAALQKESMAQLFAKRKQLTGEVFDEIKNKLLNFAKTEEYLNLITQKIEKYSQQNTGTHLFIYLNKNDFKYEKNIKKICECTLIEDSSIMLGGIKIGVNSLLYNETFDYALNEELQKFYETSGLAL